jgi:hypothetical protein
VLFRSHAAFPRLLVQRCFASKVMRCTWIGSVQGAVATWSVIRMPYFLTILDSHGLTRSLPLPVLTRSKRQFLTFEAKPCNGLHRLSNPAAEPTEPREKPLIL